MPKKTHASIPSRTAMADELKHHTSNPTTDAIKGQDMSKVMRQCRSSWCLPLTGFTVTFICGVGFSLSNTNIRADVQSIGLGLFVLWTVLGLYCTMRAMQAVKRYGGRTCLSHAIGGGVCTVLCAVLTVMSIAAVSRHRHAQPRISHTREAFRPVTPDATQLPVWIDTDPACGQNQTDDVDDCWALVAAFHSPELVIRGISTVFGNTTAAHAFRLAQHIVQRFGSPGSSPHPPVFSGSSSSGAPSWEPTPASEALATALRHERLTLIAQGPLTNIATVIVTHPEVVGQIERIIMIGGKHPGKLLHPGTQWWMHFRDLNVSKDTPAVQTVLASGVPLILMPFALATNVTITRSDLQRLASGDAAAQWLRQVSEPWMAYWEQSLHKDGFHPFDVLAIGYVTMPDLFTCAVRPARIGFSIFLAPFGMGWDLEVAPSIRGTQIYYCFDIAPQFIQRFLARIRGESPEDDRTHQEGEIAPVPGLFSVGRSWQHTRGSALLHSAHNPPFEEPEQFNTVLIEDVLPLFGESVPSLTSNR